MVYYYVLLYANPDVNSSIASLSALSFRQYKRIDETIFFRYTDTQLQAL